MKIAVATVTALAAMGTLALVPSAAQAAPYPRSIKTRCVAVAADTTVSPRENVRVKFKWTADGNINPRGPVDYVIKRNGGGTFDRGSFFSPANTKTKTLSFRLPKGNYRVKFQTDTGPNSVFRNCSASTATIKVRNRF